MSITTLITGPPMSLSQGPMAAEGWGLYSEELMAEPTAGHPTGFYTPAEYLYELQGQLLRAVRIRVDVGMHTGRMTYDEAKDYFTEHVCAICAQLTRWVSSRWCWRYYCAGRSTR